MKVKGISAANGIAIAPAFKLTEANIKIDNKRISDIDLEIKRFDEAISLVTKKIEGVKAIALKNLGSEEAMVFEAHIQVANDPAFREEVSNYIRANSINAIFATSEVSKNFIAIFEGMEDVYMRERAADIKDVSSQIIYALAGIKQVDLSKIASEVIIVAHDLTPSDTAQLNKKFVKGFVTDIGGRTSHAAIMARTLEIPAIAGLKNITSLVEDGQVLAIDGELGEVIVNPSAEEISSFEEKVKFEIFDRSENLAYKGKESITSDGHVVELSANIGSPKDVASALANDAESIGLFRSEFLYMDAKNWPSEEEQYQAYSEVLKAMDKKRVIVRTLDIGGDKTLSYFEFPKEMNPFLGYRAIRLCLDKVEIFETQLRALLRASVHGKLAIMFPMIATIDELRMAKTILQKVKDELVFNHTSFDSKIEIGIMVEIPSAAMLADQLAKEVDFFSIGTNDLIQYTFAADRMSEKVAYLYQPLNPSLLRLIKQVIEAAHAQGKWVGMCGEMAGDKMAVPILVGLGLDEFSMSATNILASRRQIANLSFREAQNLASNALQTATASEVETLINKFIRK